jgi:hypothetical protein
MIEMLFAGIVAVACATTVARSATWKPPLTTRVDLDSSYHGRCSVGEPRLTHDEEVMRLIARQTVAEALAARRPPAEIFRGTLRSIPASGEQPVAAAAPTETVRVRR